MSNADKPCLSIGIFGKKKVGGGGDIFSNFKSPGFDINSNNFTVIACFDLRLYLRLINFISTPGKFFFAISGLPNCHFL